MILTIFEKIDRLYPEKMQEFLAFLDTLKENEKGFFINNMS